MDQEGLVDQGDLVVLVDPEVQVVLGVLEFLVNLVSQVCPVVQVSLVGLGNQVIQRALVALADLAVQVVLVDQDNLVAF